MKIFFIVLVVGMFAVSSLMGCNMFRGAGKDVSNAGRSIENAGK